MANYKKFSSLIKSYNAKLKKGLKEVGKSGEQIMRDKMDEKIYNAYSPKQYERTRSAYDAITSLLILEVERTYQLKVFADPTKMNYSYMSLPPYQADEDEIDRWQTFYGDDHREHIFAILDENRGWYSRGSRFVTEGYKVFKAEFRKDLRSAMKSQGLKME